MKKRIIIALLICFSLVGCGNKNNENNNEESNKDNTIVEPSMPEELEVKVNSLKFYVPNELTVNSYNGINNTFNYYIEKSDDNCEVYLTLTNISKYDNSIDNYMNEYIKASTFNIETINNAKWNIVSSGNITNYVTKIDDCFYDVKTIINKSGNACNQVNEMIKKTLYVISK